MSDIPAWVFKYGVYLEDIRRRLYATILLSACAFVGGFALTPLFLKIGIKMFSIEGVALVATSPFQLVELAMSAGFFFFVLVGVPLCIYHIYAFLYSGLAARERRFVLILLPLVFVLFVAGFVYGFAVLYYALELVAALNKDLGIANMWDISRFVSQITITSMLLGLVFQFPLVLTFLVRLGALDARFLAHKRRHAAVVILLIVALLPPTDGLSFIVMAVPLMAMYELTIFFNSSARVRTF